jgi:RNase P subunit RPR2
MVYLLEVTKNCDDPLPMLVSGNALDPATLKVTCKCGTEANVNSARHIDLNPNDPGFQARIEQVLADSPILTYYIVTVADRQMTLEQRFRTQGSVEFHTVLECKTCGKKIGGPKCKQEDMNAFVAEHKSHDMSANTVVDSTDPRVLKLVEAAIRNQEGRPPSVVKNQ